MSPQSEGPSTSRCLSVGSPEADLAQTLAHRETVLLRTLPEAGRGRKQNWAKEPVGLQCSLNGASANPVGNPEVGMALQGSTFRPTVIHRLPWDGDAAWAEAAFSS